MHTQSMLEIHPDKIFEEKSISEIEDVQKKIQDEVERKKEDLRTMVGERYRDLIEAADTISAMQVTAAGVITRVKTMEGLCEGLQQRQLLGFQLESTRPPCISVDKLSNTVVATAVQTKILVSIPEQIWLAVEREDYLLGTQLYLLARHIKTGLLLDSSTQLESIMPVITRQWASISHFQDKLVNGAEEALAIADIAPQSVARCLCVLALLGNMKGEMLLDHFLEIRQRAVRSVLMQGDDKTNVKRSIVASLNFLLRTLSLLHCCFVEDRAGMSEGLVWKMLEALTHDNTQLSEVSMINEAFGVVDLLDLLRVEPAAMRFLPPVVRDFTPFSNASKEKIELSEVREHTSRWLGDIQTFLKGAVGSLLSLVTSIRALQTIRDTSIKHQQGVGASGCDTALHKLQLSCGSDLWMAFYQPLMSCRVRALVEQQWASALTTLRQKLADDLRAVLRDKTVQPEHDLRWLVWRERSSDLPHQSPQESSLIQNHGLLLKCRGYSPRIEALCQTLDTPLSVLLQELSAYVSETDIDRSDLQQHLQQCSSDRIKELCRHIEDDCLAGATGREEGSVVLVARLLGALCDLSPALQKCFLSLSVSSSSKVGVGMSKAWTDIMNILQTSSKEAWTVWQELVSVRLSSDLENKLPLDSGHLGKLLLHSTPQWEEHSMEEQREEGGHLQSVIRVPVQPSLALQHILAEACQVLGAAQPHTVPSSVRTTFVERLVNDILQKYHVAASSELPQVQALQFLLDMKFLTSLLVPRTQKLLSTQAQDLSRMLEEKIDPFDLDVFSPFLQNNVRQSVRQMQCLYGVLVSCWPEKLASMWTSATPGDKNISSAAEQPSTLAVCPAAPWFPLLPVVVPTNPKMTAQLPATSEKPQNKKNAGTRSPKRRTEPMENIKSGAAAFFGAMSSDWFS